MKNCNSFVFAPGSPFSFSMFHNQGWNFNNELCSVVKFAKNQKTIKRKALQQLCLNGNAMSSGVATVPVLFSACHLSALLSTKPCSFSTCELNAHKHSVSARHYYTLLLQQNHFVILLLVYLESYMQLLFLISQLSVHQPLWTYSASHLSFSWSLQTFN